MPTARRRRSPYNRAVAAMRGRPLSSLSAIERVLLHEDAMRRSEVISEAERMAIERSAKAFASVEAMEKELARMYRDCARELREYVAGVYAAVQEAGGEWSLQAMGKYKRSEALFAQINEQLRALGRRQVAFFNKKLPGVYKDAWERVMGDLGATKAQMSLWRLNPEAIKEAINYPWSGAMFSERIWENTDLLANRLRVGLTQSMVLGESVGKTAARITEGLEATKFSAERLARTEGMRVSYVAQRHAYEKREVKQVKFIATIPSERTCKVCSKLHGKVFVLGSEQPLPVHPQCRCTYAPYVELDKMPEGFLNAAVGSTKGQENYDKFVEHEAVQKKQAENQKLMDEFFAQTEKAPEVVEAEAPAERRRRMSSRARAVLDKRATESAHDDKRIDYNDSYERKEYVKNRCIDLPEDAAEVVGTSVYEFTGGDFSDIRRNWYKKNILKETLDTPESLSYNERGDFIEKYLETAPRWAGGNLYRGISLDADKFDELMGKVEFDMLGMSSWSSRESVARDFASGSSRPYIIFELDETLSGSSVRVMSQFRNEDEVVLSGRSRFEFVDVLESSAEGMSRRWARIKVREVWDL